MNSYSQQSIIVFNRFNYNTDPNNCNINLSAINVPGKTSLINLQINLTAEILEKMTLFLKLFHQGDKQYRKEFMRASFDLEKLFRGGVDTFIGKTFFGGLAKAADFPLRLPLMRVIVNFIA